MANVGFEPTPFRTSALNWRLRPLGQLTIMPKPQPSTNKKSTKTTLTARALTRALHTPHAHTHTRTSPPHRLCTTPPSSRTATSRYSLFPIRHSPSSTADHITLAAAVVGHRGLLVISTQGSTSPIACGLQYPHWTTPPRLEAWASGIIVALLCRTH